MMNYIFDRIKMKAIAKAMGFLNRKALFKKSRLDEKSKLKLAQDLKFKINELSPIEQENNNGSSLLWNGFRKKIRDNIISNDVEKFLSWKIIRHTISHECNIGVLEYLKASKNWKTIWEKNLQEDLVGNPTPYYRLPTSSGTLIHHAYSLDHLMNCNSDPDFFSRLDDILDFGGGYGSMCRLIHNLGFKGRYIIFDFPELIYLQEYFLKMLNLNLNISVNEVSQSNRGVVLLSELDLLRDQIQYFADNSLFMGSFSISETPIKFRDEIFNLIGEPRYFLIGYQGSFGEVSNAEYFKEFQGKRKTYRWTMKPLPHVPSCYNLFGTKDI